MRLVEAYLGEVSVLQNGAHHARSLEAGLVQIGPGQVGLDDGRRRGRGCRGRRNRLRFNFRGVLC
jgi:hypothetical protein